MWLTLSNPHAIDYFEELGRKTDEYTRQATLRWLREKLDHVERWLKENRRTNSPIRSGKRYRWGPDDDEGFRTIEQQADEARQNGS